MASGTHPHEADELLVAHRLVGLVVGRRAPGPGAVAERRVAAPVVVAAFHAVAQLALVRAARALQSRTRTRTRRRTRRRTRTKREINYPLLINLRPRDEGLMKTNGRQCQPNQRRAGSYSGEMRVKALACDGEHLLDGRRVHGRSPIAWTLRIGKQHFSWQSSSQPQSHSSPASTTPLPHIAVWGSVSMIQRVSTRQLDSSTTRPSTVRTRDPIQSETTHSIILHNKQHPIWCATIKHSGVLHDATSTW